MTPVSSITLTAASSPRSPSDSGPMYPAPGPFGPIPSDAMTPHALWRLLRALPRIPCVAKITLTLHQQSAKRRAGVKFSATVHNVQHLLPGTRGLALPDRNFRGKTAVSVQILAAIGATAVK